MGCGEGETACREFSGDEMEYLRKACERISDEELPDDMWATVSRIYDFIQEK